MLWRTWSFCAGIPVGVLAAWVAVGSPPSARALCLGAWLGGLALLALVSLLARLLGDGPGRAARLSCAASAGLVALPALAARVLDLAPGGAFALAGTLVVLAAALVAAARAQAPAYGFGRPLLAAALALLGGGAALLAAAFALAARGAVDPGFREDWAPGIFDLDARVATLPLLRCGATPHSVEVLPVRGARPSLAPDGAQLWFDAEAEDGSRQVHRLELATGRVECWTCGEPGNNWRPAPGDSGGSIVFETDRHASWWDPTNVEVQLMAARAEARPAPSRRLTFSAGPDAHALLAPGSRVVVWSRREGGRYEVVLASLRGGHGSVQLGTPSLVAGGGALWIAPVAWSPDARALVLARGNPLAPRSALALDLATGERRELASALAAGDSVAFRADGSAALLASAQRRRAAGLLPARLGFLLGPFALRAERRGVLLRGTGLRLQLLHEEASPTALELPDVAGWGEPTGVALARDGAQLFLGQRRAKGDERLLRISLDCAAAATD